MLAASLSQVCLRHSRQLVVAADSHLVKTFSSRASARITSGLVRTNNSAHRVGTRTATNAAGKPPKPVEGAQSAGEGKIGDQVESATRENPTMKNVALATLLFGFVAGVFRYSLNAVGRGEEGDNPELDPLAQLKAEAQEARQNKGQHLSKEDVEELESGMGDHDEASELEVAVGAPANVADSEEEANLRVYRRKKGLESSDEATKKKKPWWRFGF